jgi:hypothetical protein
MRVRWVSVALLAAHGACTVAAAELTSAPPLGATGADRGIASIRCALPTEGLFSTSRGAILEVGAGATADVLLTTAHGLPPDAVSVKRACRVIVRGTVYRIEEAWHAGGNLAGSEHDWAVVVTERLGGDVHRWRATRVTAEWLAAAVAKQASLRLVLRSADAPSDCRLETPGLRMLVAHSCNGHPGMSGSPMVGGLAAEPEPVLIAIHIGTQMRWAGTKLEVVSVARPLDAEVAAAIEAAVAHAVAARSDRHRSMR